MSQSTQLAPRPHEFWSGFWHFGWGWTLLSVLSAGFVVWVVSLTPSDHLIALRRVCDGAVKALLTSHDLAEIERSNVLIKSLDCDVGRRIGPDGAFHPRESQ
jgi:hypothetical protein